MIGSFITRGLVMILGYAYPAYECYKTVEMNKPDIEHLRFWCQYWILVAVLTISERIGDAFISWVPMYSEAKLAFFIYLWYPKTKGTTFVYDSFFKPYVAKHEPEIDRNLLELRTRAGDIAFLYWKRAANYSQTRIFDILQYVAEQSTPRPRPAQPQKQGTKGLQPAVAPNRQPTAATELESEEPPLSPSSSQNAKEVAEEVGPSQAPTQAITDAGTNTEKEAAGSIAACQVTPTEVETKTEVVPCSVDESANLLPKETVSEGPPLIRAKSSRLRKTRSAPNR